MAATYWTDRADSRSEPDWSQFRNAFVCHDEAARTDGPSASALRPVPVSASEVHGIIAFAIAQPERLLVDVEECRQPNYVVAFGIWYGGQPERRPWCHLVRVFPLAPMPFGNSNPSTEPQVGAVSGGKPVREFRKALPLARAPSPESPAPGYFHPLAAIGIRQPVPKARSVTFNPGAACLRLNSAPRTSCSTRRTTKGSKPAATIVSADSCRSM